MEKSFNTKYCNKEKIYNINMKEILVMVKKFPMSKIPIETIFVDLYVASG